LLLRCGVERSCEFADQRWDVRRDPRRLSAGDAERPIVERAIRDRFRRDGSDAFDELCEGLVVSLDELRLSCGRRENVNDQHREVGPLFVSFDQCAGVCGCQLVGHVSDHRIQVALDRRLNAALAAPSAAANWMRFWLCAFCAASHRFRRGRSNLLVGLAVDSDDHLPFWPSSGWSDQITKTASGYDAVRVRERARGSLFSRSRLSPRGSWRPAGARVTAPHGCRLT
jgi:hypothetical protein